MFKRSRADLSRMVGIAVMAGLGACASACDDAGDAGPTVDPIVVVTDRTTASTLGALSAAHGSYGSACIGRSGDWSVAVDPRATLLHPPLSVAMGNEACVLTLNSLTTDRDYGAAVPIAMTAEDRKENVAFEALPDAPIFCGNAHLAPIAFDRNFVISLLAVDVGALGLCVQPPGADVVTSTALADSVPAPNYLLDLSSLQVATDDRDVVQTATGAAELTAGSVIGQDYVVLVALAPKPTYADIDAAVHSAARTSLVGQAPQIDAGRFGLVGIDLATSPVRYLIVANTAHAVPSYQVFALTFHAAVRL